MQRVQAAEPQLANSPLVLQYRDARRGQIVAAANLAARSEGVRANMRLSEATALVDTEIRPHDPHEDIEGLCSLTEQAQQFSPIVGLEQVDKQIWAGRTLLQPECLLLDVTGLANLFGGEEPLIRQVSCWLAEQNYFGCLAIADTIGAAWALANYGTRGANCTQVPAASTKAPGVNRLTSEDKKIVPACRYRIAPAGETAAAIANLPIAALRLGQQTVASLKRLGVSTIDQLQQLPRGGLATRLGETLIGRWDQALGHQTEPVVTLPSSPDWCLEQPLEYPTQHRETMLELVRRLSRELSARLSRRGEGALRIVCRLDLVQSPPLVMQLGLFRPTNEARHLELLLSGQLEQQLQTIALAPLWRLTLQATLTAPMVWRQASLFDGGESANRQQLAQLVDTLSSRLGRQQVLSAKVRQEVRPEQACTFQPMTGRSNDGTQEVTVKKLSSRLARSRAEPNRDDPMRRPTQLYSPPVAIEVAACERQAVDAAPEVGQSDPPAGSAGDCAASRAAPPGQFKYQDTWHTVTEAIGPERLESGWWRGPSTRRDYFRMTTKAGSWFWIYRDLNSGQWYLHGTFD